MKRFLTQNLGVKWVSLLIAIVIWLIVLGSRKISVVKDIPIQVITSENTAVANEIPEKISFRLNGPKAFIRTVVERQESPIKINLSQTKPGLVTYRVVPENIQLPLGVEVNSITPSAVLIKLEKVRKKRVPIKLELAGAVPSGFALKKSKVTPRYVTIRGASSRVRSISEVSVLPIDISVHTKPIELPTEFDLSRMSGVVVSEQSPKVFLDIRASSSNYKIRNVQVKVQSESKVEILDQRVTLLVRASAEDYAKIDRKQIYAELDLRDKKSGEYTLEPRFVLPSEISLSKAIPEYIRVILR